MINVNAIYFYFYIVVPCAPSGNFGNKNIELWYTCYLYRYISIDTLFDQIDNEIKKILIVLFYTTYP